MLVMHGVPTEMVVVISFASFVVGVAVTALLWFLHTRMGWFRYVNHFLGQYFDTIKRSYIYNSHRRIVFGLDLIIIPGMLISSLRV